jgi:hypothetical protein
MTKVNGPYRAVEKIGYWVLVDTRTNEPASFPTTKRNCKDEERYMNRVHAEYSSELA